MRGLLALLCLLHGAAALVPAQAKVPAVQAPSPAPEADLLPAAAAKADLVPVKADLFVRNLPRGATKALIRETFAPVCEVSNVRIPVDRATGESRGFAFVTIDADSYGAAKTQLAGLRVGGRRVTVELAAPCDDAGQRKAKRKQGPSNNAAIAINKQLVTADSCQAVLAVFEASSADFNYVNVATSLHRLGVLWRTFDKSSKPQLQKLVDKATASVLDDASEWEARELSNACWGAAKVSNGGSAKVGHAQTQFLLDAVAFETRKKIGTFSAQNLANTAWAYATAGIEAPFLFEAVALEAAKKMGTFSSQALANTAWAYSTSGAAEQHRTLFTQIAAEAPKKIHTFNSQELANIVWAYSTAGFAAPALFEAVAREAPRKMASFNPQALANIVWVFSTAGVESPKLFEAVAEEAPQKIASFNAQDLANIVWAFSTAGIKTPVLFEAVAKEASSKIATFNTQALTNTAWAFAKAGVAAPALFEAVALEAPKKMAAFKSQELANMAWAFARAGFEAPLLFGAVAAESSKKMATFNPQNLANIVWAFAKAGVAAPVLFEAVSAEAVLKIGLSTPQNLGNIAWAYSTAGVDSSLLFEAVAKEARSKMASFNTQALANTAWAFATSGAAESHEALFSALAAEAEKKVGQFSLQELSNTAWAFSTAGFQAPLLFEAIASKIEPKIEAFGPDELTQLHQVYVHLRLDAPGHALTLFLSKHETALKAAHLRQGPSPSRAQRDASAALTRIGWAHEFEHVTAEGFRLDMAQPETKLAVEFDGPAHYLVGSRSGERTRVLNGSSKFKERVLRSLGWQLLRVPYLEWGALRTSSSREGYLRAKTENWDKSEES